MYHIKSGVIVTVQIDSYLKRVFSESGLSYLDDYYDLYDFVPNEDLRRLLASYHTQLNNWFVVMNSDIRKEYDEDDNLHFIGGYFHAQDSRDYLSLIENIDHLKSKLSASEYAFTFCNEAYTERIRQCRRFVVRSGGSTIPENFAPIEIEELNPIFQMSKSIALHQDQKTLYANLKFLGKGSYARVYSYMDPNYQIPIVLKRALPELNAKELERFKQEYHVLKSLNSPYIITVYAYHEDKNEYSMEYMDETICNYISKNNTKLDLTTRKRIIAQICKGLSYIHGKGLLHRDISLTNIFIKHYEDVDVVKIGDFGLVKIPESNLTSLQSDFKGSLNDSDLINVGFGNYKIYHETYALTRLCYFILTGGTSIDKQTGSIREFWHRGTSTNIQDRFQSVDELMDAVKSITN